MSCKFLIAVVAAFAPLALCQMSVSPVLGQLNPIGNYVDQVSSSGSQAQASAGASSSSNSAGLLNANAIPYLSGLQVGPGIGPGIGGIGAIGGIGGIGGIAGVPGVAGLPGVPALPLAPGSPIPEYNPYLAQEAISESLAETNLASKIRQGAIQLVPPCQLSQAVLQSVQVPVQGRYSSRVYASQPLPPMVVSQPGSPPVQISSGPAAVVSAAPVVYRQPPSVVYQNEVINRHPAPLSLNPVYVKVYKPGKKVVAPSAPMPPC